jgi:hypothetical protein
LDKDELATLIRVAEADSFRSLALALVLLLGLNVLGASQALPSVRSGRMSKTSGPSAVTECSS